MKKITNLVVVFTLLLTGLVYGQQDPHYTQYMYNQNILNPAYAGSRGDLSIGLLGRTQWVGLDGAPDTQTLNVHGALGNNLGIGVSFIHDQIGPVDESNIMLDLSYTIQVSESANLAFGVKGSYNMLNFGKTNPLKPDDVALINIPNQAYPNVGAGLYLYTDKFYAGFSVPNILENYEYSFTDNDVLSDVSDKMHFFGTLGYVFDISENLKFKPSTMIKMVQGAPISFDLNGSFFINDMFEMGLSWREGDSIDALIGVQVAPTIRVGYAYDYTLTRLGNYNSGSHELMLLFDLDFAKKHIKSPRFF
jgi:type IX secretion system PorP/SprF family membrane protein